MPSKTYYLNEEKSDIITAKWRQLYENFELSHNNQALGVVPCLSHLPTGTSYQLPDGRVLTAPLVRTHDEHTLELGVDGELMPGSGTNPERTIKHALYVLLFMGLVNATVGFVALSGGLGLDNLLEGGILVGLGWWGFSRHSAIAFYIGMALLTLSRMLSFVAAFDSSSSLSPFVGVAGQIFFCITLHRGAQAARELRTERAQEKAEASNLF